MKRNIPRTFIPCTYCGGTGLNKKKRPCERCHGKGYIVSNREPNFTG